MMTSTGRPQKTLFYCKSLLEIPSIPTQHGYTKLEQLNTTCTTTINYHYNSDVTT